MLKYLGNAIPTVWISSQNILVDIFGVESWRNNNKKVIINKTKWNNDQYVAAVESVKKDSKLTSL